MPTRCVELDYCGTHYPIWVDDKLPERPGDRKELAACINTGIQRSVTSPTQTSLALSFVQPSIAVKMNQTTIATCLLCALIMPGAERSAYSFSQSSLHSILFQN